MEKYSNIESIERCKCCMDEVELKDLWIEHYDDDKCEVFGEMLSDCFGLEWERPSDDYSEHICETCISRLYIAVNFKKKILCTQQLLQEQYETEYLEEESNSELETEYLSIEYLEEDSDNDKADIKKESSMQMLHEERLNKKTKNYAEDDLQNCVETILSKSLSQKKASILYNIPRKAISSALAKRQLLSDPIKERKCPNLQKSQENLDCIMKYTNATPFRGFYRVGYTCHFCPEKYEKPSELKTHTMICHLTKQALRLTLVSDTNLKLDITGLKCKVCDEHLDTLESVASHLAKVHDEKIHTDTTNYLIPFKFDSEVLKCVVCSKDFLSFKLLNDHMNVNHYSNFSCPKCGRGFINSRSLISHSRRHETGVFKCKYCSKVFTNRLRSVAHERSVHLFKSKRNKCGYCEERFKDVVQKKNHEVSVHNAPKQVFSCRACDKTYKTQRSLRIHIRAFHLMLRPYKCKECDFAAFKNIELQMHMLKHTKIKKYTCEVCKKCFGRKSALSEHTRIHTNDKRFKCVHCGHDFVQKGTWKNHMRAKHDVVV